MKRLFVCYALLFFGITAMPANARSETLKDAVLHTLETNPQVRAVHHNRLARDEEVVQAKSAYYPTLDFSAGIGKNEVFSPDEYENVNDPREVRFSLRQNLFNGFITANEVNRQENRVKSAAFQLQGTSENLALRVAEVYLDVLRSQAIHDLAKENLAVHERIHDQVRLRSQSGIDERVNLDQVFGRLSLAQSNVIVTEINIIDARTNYHAVVDHFPENLETVEPLVPYLPTTLEVAQNKAVENHPVLKSAQADLDARKAQYRVAQGSYSPVLDLEVDKAWEEDWDDTIDTRDWKDSLEATIRLRFNLLNGGKDSARIAETLQLVCEARAIRDNTHRQVVESIRLSWMAYQSAQKKIGLLKKYAESTGKTAEAYTKQWNIGKRTMLDVLDTKAEYINAQADLTNAIYDSLYAQCRILSGMGMLVHTLGLHWPGENGNKEAFHSAVPANDNG